MRVCVRLHTYMHTYNIHTHSHTNMHILGCAASLIATRSLVYVSVCPYSTTRLSVRIPLHVCLSVFHYTSVCPYFTAIKVTRMHASTPSQHPHGKIIPTRGNYCVLRSASSSEIFGAQIKQCYITVSYCTCTHSFGACLAQHVQ